VKAHLQHVQLYSGEPVDDPVADRTRKVRDWGILTNWQKGLKKPIRFSDLTKRWSPGDSGYARDIASVAERFMADYCNKPDPAPEQVAEARGESAGGKAVASADQPADRPSGADLARAAMERGRAEGQTQRSGLGAGAMARTGAATTAIAAPAAAPAVEKPAAPAYTVLNAPKADETPKAEAPKADKPATVQTASAAGATKPAAGANSAPAANAASESGTAKCRVWTASYGGQKAIIIRAVVDGVSNFTVLDVNEGAEKREADAYIAAYARGGRTVGEFGSQAQALDKAFELCPEG
jgi:hypothetical protein